MRPLILTAALLLPLAARAETPALGQLLGQIPDHETPAVATPKGVPVLPAEFEVREHVIALTDTFSLKAGGQTYGRVTQKLISLTKSFTFTDAAGTCIAQARQRILSWGSHVDVTDCSGAKVGAIKEQVFKSLFKIHTTYSILDASDREIAISEKVDWISTSVTLTKPNGGLIATLKRPWLNILADSWTVKVSDKTAVDPRLIVMIAAYKTSVDNDRRAESE